MTGKILAREDYRLVVSTRWSGHRLAIVFGAALAAVAVLGIGL